MPGWRATDNARLRKVGIAADTFEAFKRKACDKLQKSYDNCKCYIAENGTLICDEEYFKTVKPQTLFVIIDDDETVKTDVDLEFEKCMSTNYLEVGRIIKDFFKANPELLKGLAKKLKLDPNKFTSKSHLSKRDEHQEWFLGIQKYNTKEEYMASRAEMRIKSYLSRAKMPINKRDEYLDLRSPAHGKIKNFWCDIDKLLKAHNYHTYYFDRKSDSSEKFCDESGNFICEGKWNERICSEKEVINPYASREERTIFKAWNLDHAVEMSRGIVPSISKAISIINKDSFKCCRCDRISSDGYLAADMYYKLLFTRENLKLVSEICHDKCKHDAFEDIYIVCKYCRQN